jgi:hypothetical protein
MKTAKRKLKRAEPASPIRGGMKRKTETKSRSAGSTEPIDVLNPNEIDYLIVALGRIGGKVGAARAASELRISVRKVYSIIERGVGHLRYREVVEISKRSGISVYLLRMGGLAPWQKQQISSH